MAPTLTLRGLWMHDTLWRFVDALAPRGFGFLIHTWLIWRYGADSYALPAWIIATFGLINSLIPDPSGYVLLAKTTPQAKRRVRLLTPWLWSKILLGLVITITAPFILTLPLLKAQPFGTAIWALIGSSAFAVAEALWATCGTNRFATGQLNLWAQWGMALRMSAFAAVLILDRLAEIGIGETLLIFSLPLLGACIFILPIPHFGRRSLVAGLVALRRYSLWTQINGFLSTLLAQAPVFFAGYIPNISPANVGYLSYATRVLNFLIQPLTVLQSVIVRSYARHNQAPFHPLFYRRIYRCSGILTLIISFLLAWISPEIEKTLWILGGSLGVFVALRFELALLMSLRDVKFLSTQVFLPATLLFSIAITILHNTLVGIAIAVASSYLLISTLTAIQARKRIPLIESR